MSKATIDPMFHFIKNIEKDSTNLLFCCKFYVNLLEMQNLPQFK